MDPQTRALRTKLLGAMLREARVSAGKSLKEAARLAGIRPATLASFESGRKAISLPELELLSFRLNLPLEKFWSGGSSAPPRSASDLDPATVLTLRHHMVGALLRTHRRAASFSIRQLSDKVSIPASRLSAYERGERPVPLPDLLAIAAALGQPIEEYLDQGGPIGVWSSSKRAYESLVGLPEDLRRFVSNPASRPYLQLAKRLSELPADKLRSLAEELRELSV
ncbi:MAG: helix-turn-helix domain-containing protein [Anaerolineales bacterium]